MHSIFRTTAALGFLALMVTAVAWASLSNGGLDNAGYSAGLAAAKAATVKYSSLSVAKADGYALLKDKNGIACIANDAMDGMPMGAMGVHYARGAIVGDGQLSSETPEALVYAPQGGKLRLAAVEYVVLKAGWDAKHAQEPVMFGHKFNETYGGNRFGLPAFYSLHVWLFKHNPTGEFSMWNPLVHCGGA
jgi:hypothetical protein